MERKKDPSEYMIQAVDAALNILEQYHGDVVELRATELAQRLGLSRNNATRLLATLTARGYLERDRATDAYRLGLGTLELGQVAAKQRNLMQTAPLLVRQMAQACDETGYLVVLKQGWVVYVAVAESSQPVRIVSRLGMWRPLHCTASGKVHLAFMTPEDRALFLPNEHLEKLTERTLPTRAALEAELATVARQGYAIDNEELEAGVRCVASPIRDYSGRVIGAFSLSGPAERFSEERIAEELAPLVCRTSADLSARLGFKP